MGTNISGLISPHTNFNNAFNHSTLSGVGGLNSSALLRSASHRTLSTSFSIFLPAFSAAIHVTTAILANKLLLTNHASHPMCLPHAVNIHATKHRAEVAEAPVRRMFFACSISTGATGGGKGCRAMLPTWATTGAG